MKLLIVLLMTSFVYEVQAACNRPVDPNKIVLMLSFHDGSEEARGAAEGACARGEKLVVLPIPTPEYARLQTQYQALVARLTSSGNSNCRTPECTSRVQSLLQQYTDLQNRMKNLKPDYQAQLREFMRTSASGNAKISSLILSGHDGGGHYYGDYGETTMAEISTLAKENPAAFGDTSSLLLMGCWSGTPDQVEQWKVVFPKMRLIGGFVGSAPTSTRIAAGTYISGLLRGESTLREEATRANVQSMLNTVNHLNLVTAGVYINPSCDEEGRSPAYYYASPANAAAELPDGVRAGLNNYAGSDAQKLACLRTFGGAELPATYDWSGLMQYYQGIKEPGNTAELRSLYSYLRNNEHCFENGYSQAAISPDQVLMLRFFQDTKKNFNKFFHNDLEAMYLALDAMVAESTDPEVKAAYEAHKKLSGDSLIGMTRKETVGQVAALQKVSDLIFRKKETRTEQDDLIMRTMRKIDTHLFQLSCLPPTWHEYIEGETPAAPTCN